MPEDEALEAKHVALGTTKEIATQQMHQLRALHNAVADAYTARDEFIYQRAVKHDLSRPDMAIACGMNKSRIDQIIEQMKPPRAS